MHLEIFEGKGAQPWRWHFKSGRFVTADSEGFPNRANAIRAGRAVVAACVKPVVADAAIAFTRPVWDRRRRCFVVKWSGWSGE